MGVVYEYFPCMLVVFRSDQLIIRIIARQDKAKFVRYQQWQKVFPQQEGN